MFLPTKSCAAHLRWVKSWVSGRGPLCCRSSPQSSAKPPRLSAPWGHAAHPGWPQIPPHGGSLLHLPRCLASSWGKTQQSYLPCLPWCRVEMEDSWLLHWVLYVKGSKNGSVSARQGEHELFGSSRVLSFSLPPFHSPQYLAFGTPFLGNQLSCVWLVC